ncbi:OpgC domain-containing protein [Paracoccus shanxieyensis]|uniref:OpgC domain-containing protein n=1 Tax=Paracoccus shanxieyensis TaxID=2675752 RepID=A0A6L6ITZ9_9RHOB|nr:OpgC domain-containing protein [Paracoccus shanxieyensis]MTH63633.1 OpgC domain-containing protein [Paracoccus shanxieyensis]MTH86556.1 OpgC domain-containing protein [Paracoccus shanxieyensis]
MKRIAALDMLRGYALICIMLDHMPIGVLRNVTLANFTVFDAAELFVLLSGFLVGMVWVKIEARHGRGAAQWRFLKRAYEVWLALVLGAVLLAAFSHLLFELRLNHTAVWFRYAQWLTENPLGYIGTVALMWMQPNLLDVLALYVIMLVTAPVTVPFLLRMPWTAMAVSIIVWLFAEPLNALIPNQRPGPGLLFNPFGWQLLFFIGVGLGAFRRQILPALRKHSALLTAISVGVLLFCLAITLSWRIGEPAKAVSAALKMVYGSIDKWSLDGLRLMAIMAATWLVAVTFARPFEWMANTVIGRAFGDIGRGGLWSFISCVLLSIWGDAMDMLAPADFTGFLLRLAIDIWVIAALWASAALWLRREEWTGRIKARFASR